MKPDWASCLWCETKGIKFGTNLNAYTSIDKTVYRISNIPTDNVSVVDSCLLILHRLVKRHQPCRQGNRQRTWCDP